MKKLNLTVLSILITALTLLAQDKKEFKPSGKVFVKIFTNFHTGIGKNNDNQGFELDRSYFGYKYSFAKNLTGTVTFDIGNPSNNSKLERTAYVKNAMLNWKENNLSVDFGLIGTKAFKMQEDFWGYRYLYKSFQDDNKYNTSADMGISVTYTITKGLSADVSMTNGEGYKNLQNDNKYRYGAGLTYSISGLTLRAYADMLDKVEETKESQKTIALFAGYKIKAFSIGAEYNMMSNYKYNKDNNMNGISIYSTYKANDKIKLFGRFDKLSSKDNWNISKDGSTIIAGFEYSPIKNLKVSPNVRMWNPKKDGLDNSTFAYLSLQIAF